MAVDPSKAVGAHWDRQRRGAPPRGRWRRGNPPRGPRGRGDRGGYAAARACPAFGADARPVLASAAPVARARREGIALRGAPT